MIAWNIEHIEQPTTAVQVSQQHPDGLPGTWMNLAAEAAVPFWSQAIPPLMAALALIVIGTLLTPRSRKWYTQSDEDDANQP